MNFRKLLPILFFSVALIGCQQPSVGTVIDMDGEEEENTQVALDLEDIEKCGNFPQLGLGEVGDYIPLICLDVETSSCYYQKVTYEEGDEPVATIYDENGEQKAQGVEPDQNDLCVATTEEYFSGVIK